jgi:peptide/nickel transport system permease protein
MGSEGGASAEELQRIYELAELYMNLDPSEPMHIAYLNYMADFVRGDLGRSLFYNEPVIDLLGHALPWTLFVLSWGLFISFFVGILLGSLMAYWEGGKLDVGLSTYSVVMGSTPYYVLALFLVVFLAYQAKLFPTGGRVPEGVQSGFNLAYIRGVVYHATLPILSTVVLSGLASLAMRGNSIRVLGEDYMRVAQLRGLSDTVIATQYVARNAILPMYTGFMISVGTVFGGSVILEIIFVYRGVGFYLVEAARARDYPLMMGGFVLITFCVVVALLIADLTYPMLDPRAESGGGEAF